MKKARKWGWSGKSGDLVCPLRVLFGWFTSAKSKYHRCQHHCDHCAKFAKNQSAPPLEEKTNFKLGVCGRHPNCFRLGWKYWILIHSLYSARKPRSIFFPFCSQNGCRIDSQLLWLRNPPILQLSIYWSRNFPPLPFMKKNVVVSQNHLSSWFWLRSHAWLQSQESCEIRKI